MVNGRNLKAADRVSHLVIHLRDSHPFAIVIPLRIFASSLRSLRLPSCCLPELKEQSKQDNRKGRKELAKVRKADQRSLFTIHHLLFTIYL